MPRKNPRPAAKKAAAARKARQKDKAPRHIGMIGHIIPGRGGVMLAALAAGLFAASPAPTPVNEGESQ